MDPLSQTTQSRRGNSHQQTYAALRGKTLAFAAGYADSLTAEGFLFKEKSLSSKGLEQTGGVSSPYGGGKHAARI